MTKPDKVRVSDAELNRVELAVGCQLTKRERETLRTEIRALIAKRVPDNEDDGGDWDRGFAYCKEAVLRGPG